ncbi:DUF6350 family protein [Actinomycetospora sp. TBRC 11914]|uniref:cell division protein PerM n=1 Tax=Actinomycetospora sp. TBRC 11914 TaxID=2729387 RepID=UPI00145E6016|nr:DUF6350 family protein [Actinomycetospora sp. TBRC 11914]NMO93838.1 hypothetical protein [Actinomycetospora sp. TBRC 11914]
MSAAAPTSGVPAPGTPAPSRPGRGDRRRGGLPPRLGVLAEVALVPVLVSYAVVVVLAALVTASASGTTPGGQPGLGQALGIGVPLWLAVHLVPLTVSGAPLGMLPLAPAAGVAVLVAVLARRGVVRLGALPGGALSGGALPGGEHAADDPDAGRHDRWTSHGVPVVAAVAAVHAAAGVLAAALLTPDTGSLPADASPATAGTVAGLLAALSAAAGVAGPCGLGTRVRAWPEWVGRGLRAGLGAAVALVAGGAALLLVVLLAHADAVAGSFAAVAPDAGSGAGLWLVDAAYLPNAVVAAASWLLGPGYAVGAVAASPTGATPGLVPPLPLAALLPAGPPPSWAGLAFALPLAVGSTVGWLLAPVGAAGGDLLRRVRPVLVAALTAAVVLAVAAGLAGGRLGSGPFDPVVVPAGLVLLVTCAWIAVPGVVVALLATPAGAPARGRRRPTASDRRAGATEQAPEAAAEPAAETEAGETEVGETEVGEDAAGGTDEDEPDDEVSGRDTSTDERTDR